MKQTEEFKRYKARCLKDGDFEHIRALEAEYEARDLRGRLYMVILLLLWILFEVWQG